MYRVSSSSHYIDVIMTAMASQITSLTVVYSTVYSDADQRKHQSSASLAFVWGIHRWPVNSPHKWPVSRKMFPFDDVIMGSLSGYRGHFHWLQSRHEYVILWTLKYGMKLPIQSQTSAVELWEWISTPAPYFIMGVISYPCWDDSLGVLVKGVTITNRIPAD